MEISLYDTDGRATMYIADYTVANKLPPSLNNGSYSTISNLLLSDLRLMADFNLLLLGQLSKIETRNVHLNIT